MVFVFCLCQFGESIGFILCSRYENRTVLNWKPYGFDMETVRFSYREHRIYPCAGRYAVGCFDD